MINLTQNQLTELIESKGFNLSVGTKSDSMELNGEVVRFEMDLVSFSVDNKVWFAFSAFNANDLNTMWNFEGRQNVWSKGRNDKTWRVEQRAEKLLGLS